MTTLVVGAGGMVGSALRGEGRRRGEEIVALTREALDITRREDVLAAAASVGPSAIVNCAALTAVDECETRFEEALEVNGAAVGHLAEAARRASAHLVQISTDFVFSGHEREPYGEDHPPAPLSSYGRSKLEGERQTLAWERGLVVRTSWLFGPDGGNFVATIADLIRRGSKPLRVVSDQVGCPTYTPYLAAAIWDLLRLRYTGIVNYRNRDPVSWHGLATRVAALLGDPDEVEAVSTQEMARPASRPSYSVLDVSRFETLTGRAVEAWETGLEEYLRDQ